MKIAIHKTGGFSGRWIEYCEKNGIEYKIVNCYSSSIINDLRDCDALMWHYHHEKYTDSLFAKQLLFALEHSGMTVFPDFKTSWHFDDKIGQKYLLESAETPLVPSYIFYSKSAALNYLQGCTFPVVFKLRSGAGSKNVLLIENLRNGKKIVNQAFGRGFKAFNRWYNLQERVRRYNEGIEGLFGIIKGIARIFKPPIMEKMLPKQRHYAYFQDFIPGNDSDTRVVVIGNNAFAIKRLIRKNDFRASGSGKILFEKELFKDDTIELAFKTADDLQASCIALDFVQKDGKPLLTEISYGYTPGPYDACPGYWDKELNWHEGEFNHCGWMVDLVVKEMNSKGLI